MPFLKKVLEVDLPKTAIPTVPDPFKLRPMRVRERFRRIKPEGRAEVERVVEWLTR
jgi:hypothetical protein